MITPAVELQPPSSCLAYVVSHPDPKPDTRLSDILKAIARLLENTRAPKWIAPTFEVVEVRDYLAELHQLSEFAAYQSARIDGKDEPLFARELWRGDVVTFQGKSYIVRKALKRPSCGDHFVTLEKNMCVSSNLLTLVAKALPNNRLWPPDTHGREASPFTNQFTFPDGSPTAMDKLTCYVGCGYDSSGPACLRLKAAVRFSQVTIEDVASAQWKNAVGIHASKAAVIRNGSVAKHLNFCPRCWVARVQHVPIPTNRACKDCRGLVQLDAAEVERSASRAKTLEDYCAQWKAKRQRKLEARAYVYSPEEVDLAIIAERKNRGAVEVAAITDFDHKMWNKAQRQRASGKHRIQ